jgi:hypothetical protein
MISDCFAMYDVFDSGPRSSSEPFLTTPPASGSGMLTSSFSAAET